MGPLAVVARRRVAGGAPPQPQLIISAQPAAGLVAAPARRSRMLVRVGRRSLRVGWARSVHVGLYLNGAEVEAESGRRGALVNPATGGQVGTTALAGPEDVDAAVKGAKACFESAGWREMGARGRGRALRRLARSLREKLPELVEIETACTGRPKKEFQAQLGRVPEWFEYHASVAETAEGAIVPFGDASDHVGMVTRRPLGVCGLITAANHPLLLACKKVSVALAAGNCCVLKPPASTPASVVELAKLATEAGLPDGALNVATGDGDAGAFLAAHQLVEKVDFTGGTVAGRKVGALVGARGRAACLELGGNAPVLVFQDVDVDRAVDGVAFAAFVASGQTCVSAKRILVHETIFDTFASKLVKKVRGLVIGDPSDLKTQIGPLLSFHARDKLALQVREAVDAGAELLTGGSTPSTARCALADVGAFYEPTVLSLGAPSNRRGGESFPEIKTSAAAASPPGGGGGSHPAVENPAFVEELFGPVVTLTPFATESQALRLANDNRYALGASVYTNQLNRAHRVAAALTAGVVWANTHHRNAPDAPWGGSRDSGVGRENGLEAFRQYTQPATFVIRTSDTPEDWFGAAGSAGGGTSAPRYG